MTSLKTSIKTITYLSDTGCLEIQGASLLVDGVFAHRFIRIMITGKNQLLMLGYFPYLFQNNNGLTGKRNYMWCPHFRATSGIADTGDSLASGWDGPDFVSEIDLRPTGETQFAGTDEQVQSK